MRFVYPHLPAEFEIPTPWWKEAGMFGFKPATRSYLSSTPNVMSIPLREIEPPVRSRDYPLDFGGFDRTRMVRILAGFVASSEIEAVPLAELPELEFPKNPFRYRVRNGMHRFHASVAAGYRCLSAVVL